MNSGSRLRELMSILGKTAEELCKECGLPKSSVSMWLNNNRSMRADKIGIISERYGVDPAWLMGYDVPMYRDKQDDLDAFGRYLDSIGWKVRKVDSDMREISDESVSVRIPNSKYLAFEDKIRKECTNVVLEFLSESLAKRYRSKDSLPIAAHGDGASIGEISDDLEILNGIEKDGE